MSIGAYFQCHFLKKGNPNRRKKHTVDTKSFHTQSSSSLKAFQPSIKLKARFLNEKQRRPRILISRVEQFDFRQDFLMIIDTIGY